MNNKYSGIFIFISVLIYYGSNSVLEFILYMIVPSAIFYVLVMQEKQADEFEKESRMFKLFMVLLFVVLGFVYYVALIPDTMFFVATMILGSIVLLRQYLKRDKKNIDDSLAAMRTLIKWANENNIGQHALTRSIEALRNTTSLNLSNQGITQLPKEIGSLYNLEELNLDYNLLVELPDEIRTLVNLHTLNLSNNKFKRRPKILATLPDITTLTLENNQIFRQSPEIEAFNFLAGDIAHRLAGVEIEDEDNLLNRASEGAYKKDLPYPNEIPNFPTNDLITS